MKLTLEFAQEHNACNNKKQRELKWQKNNSKQSEKNLD